MLKRHSVSLCNLNGKISSLLDSQLCFRNPRFQSFPIIAGRRNDELPFIDLADLVGIAGVVVVKGKGGLCFVDEAGFCFFVTGKVVGEILPSIRAKLYKSARDGHVIPS